MRKYSGHIQQQQRIRCDYGPDCHLRYFLYCSKAKSFSAAYRGASL